MACVIRIPPSQSAAASSSTSSLEQEIAEAEGFPARDRQGAVKRSQLYVDDRVRLYRDQRGGAPLGHVARAAARGLDDEAERGRVGRAEFQTTPDSSERSTHRSRR